MKTFKQYSEDNGCLLDEELEIHELIEEEFLVSGDELYEDWGEPLEEAEKGGRKVSLGKPFLTPGGPKKRAVYVKNENGNVVKVNFGDPNMTIKKNIPNIFIQFTKKLVILFKVRTNYIPMKEM